VFPSTALDAGALSLVVLIDALHFKARLEIGVEGDGVMLIVGLALGYKNTSQPLTTTSAKFIIPPLSLTVFPTTPAPNSNLLTAEALPICLLAQTTPAESNISTIRLLVRSVQQSVRA